MDPVKREITEGHCQPLLGCGTGVKQEPPWTMKEERDHPSAVHSPEQPLADNTSGSVLSVNTTRVCRHCSAAFVLASSLELHLAACHGEPLPSSEGTDLPVFSTPDGWDNENTDEKQEPPWTMKEGSPDQPSAVDSSVQPLADNTCGPALSVNTAHACRHCSAAFVLAGSLQGHVASFHGADLHDLSPVPSTPGRCGNVNHGTIGNSEAICSHSIKKATESEEEKVDEDNAGEKGGERSRQSWSDVCKTSFTSASKLKSHKLTRTGLEPSTCDVCSKTSARRGTSNKHNQIHSHGLKPFVCDVCRKTFTSASKLKRHELTHTNHKPFMCDVCSKSFSQTGTLNRHKLIHTDRRRPFVCDVCSKAFIQASDMKTHKLIHTGHKPFVCDVCNKGFAQSGDLTMHKRTHTGERPHRCPHCGSGFKRSGHLQSHIRSVHAGARPYVCDVCGARFSLSGNLTTHRRIHTGNKPFVCPDCGKPFTRSSCLTTHRLTHTGERPHSCPHCPLAFMWSQYLKRHIQKTHR